MRRLLFLAHTHVYGPFRVGSHHYARAAADDGVEVVHLSTPVSVAHRALGRVDTATLRATPSGPRRDDAGVTHLVPRTALPRPYGAFRVAHELARHGLPVTYDAVLLDQPLLWDTSVRALAPRLIYRPTDLYPSGVKAALQTQTLAEADGIIATSDTVLRALGTASLPSLVIENGVDATRFTPPDETARPAVVIYVGAIDARFDGARVDAWARAHPTVRFVVAGPAPARATDLPDNVEFIGPVSYAQLPALLAGARVGILPLSADPLNAGRSPMKLYEYLAAGLVVVSRENPAIRPDHAAGLFTYSGEHDADAALRTALGAPSPNAAGVARAHQADWATKAAQLREFVESLPVR